MQSLLRNRSSGNYYDRRKITVNGKPKHQWVNFETDVFRVAKLRVLDEDAMNAVLRKSASNITARKVPVADLINVYESPERRQYRHQTVSNRSASGRAGN